MTELQTYLIRWLQSVAQCNSVPDPQGREVQIRAKCAELRQTLTEKGYTRPQVEALLNALNVGQGWIDLLDRYEVFGRFPPAIAPTSTAIAQPTQGGLVRLPPRQQTTAIQSSPKGDIAITESTGDVVGTLVRGTGILEQLASSDLSLFISGQSNSGKSTLARALALAIHRLDPMAEFYFLEPQDEPWLGLEQYRSIVRYCSFEDLETPAQLLEEAYQTYQKRYKQRHELVRQGVESPGEHPIWIFVNEWNNIFDTWDELPAKERQERKIDSMLLHVRSIIRAGRKVQVRLVLLGQEHTKEATGLSPQIKKSMGFISTGLLLPDGNGGYSSILGLIKDRYLLEKHQQELLQKVYQEAVRERIPLLATTLGVPRLAELPNYAKAKTASIVSSYRYKPIEIQQLERIAR